MEEKRGMLIPSNSGEFRRKLQALPRDVFEELSSAHSLRSVAFKAKNELFDHTLQEIICDYRPDIYQKIAEDVALVFPNLKDRINVAIKYRNLRNAKVATIRSLISKSFRQRKFCQSIMVENLTLSPEDQLVNFRSLKPAKKKLLIDRTRSSREKMLVSGFNICQVLERFLFPKEIERIFDEYKIMNSAKNLKYINMRITRKIQKFPNYSSEELLLNLQKIFNDSGRFIFEDAEKDLPEHPIVLYSQCLYWIVYEGNAFAKTDVLKDVIAATSMLF
ncbi:MAG: hypothetical protein MHMPM18_000118 [Marteilia pararefringens]